jgi:HAD superfamily hydrolase (TIGR01509 family)
VAHSLVIFDCDGVLVDSEPIVNRLLVEALAQEGLPLSLDEVDRAFLGLSWSATLDIIEARLGRPVAGDFLDRIQRASFDAFRRELRPVRGIEAALERIGQPVCVASSGEHAKIRNSLELTGLLSRFEGRLFSAEQVARGKPYPDLFLFAAQSLGVLPAECAVIEDSLNGVRGAAAAGMTVFAYEPAEALVRGWHGAFRDAGATVFQDMGELPSLLDGA